MNSRSEKDLKYKHLKSEYVFTSILSGLPGIFFSLNAYFLEGKRHESQHLETLLSGGITNTVEIGTMAFFSPTFMLDLFSSENVAFVVRPFTLVELLSNNSTRAHSQYPEYKEEL